MPTLQCTLELERLKTVHLDYDNLGHSRTTIADVPLGELKRMAKEFLAYHDPESLASGLPAALKLEPNGCYVLKLQGNVTQHKMDVLSGALHDGFPDMRFMILDDSADIVREQKTTE